MCVCQTQVWRLCSSPRCPKYMANTMKEKSMKRKKTRFIGKIYIYYVYTDNTENERSDDS